VTLTSRNVIAITLAAGLALAACSKAPSAEESAETASAETAVEDSKLSSAAVLAAACSGCHGEAGEAMTSLAGRDADTLEATLLGYKTDADGMSVMHRLMRGYSDEDIASVSAWIANEEMP